MLALLIPRLIVVGCAVRGGLRKLEAEPGLKNAPAARASSGGWCWKNRL